MKRKTVTIMIAHVPTSKNIAIRVQPQSFNYEIDSFFLGGRFFKIPFKMTVIRMIIDPT